MQLWEYKVEPMNNKTANFQCYINEINFETPNIDNPSPGYYIKLETL